MEPIAEGKEARLLRSASLSRRLERLYGRRGLALKLFTPRTRRKEWTLEDVKWGGVPLEEATKIQNVFSWYGLAPRIYGLLRVNEQWVGQAVRFAQYPTREKAPERALKVAQKYRLGMKGITTERGLTKQLGEVHRWIGSQIVDFGRFFFADPLWYKNKMRDHVYRYHKKPHTESVGYHPCPELGVSGVRQIDERMVLLGWDDIEWRGKTVLDLGCNIGSFSHEAEKRGARRIVAVDHKFKGKNIQLANWLGYFNVDFLELSLPRQRAQIAKRSGIHTFDIVICLSMIGHAGGYAKWLPNLVGGVMFFSGQGAESRAKYQGALERDFARVEWRGYAEDRGKHPAWRVYKNALRDVGSG